MQENQNNYVGMLVVILFSVASIATGKNVYALGVCLWLLLIILSKGKMYLKVMKFPYFPIFLYGVFISIGVTLSSSIDIRNTLIGMIDISNPILFLSIGGIISIISNKDIFFKWVIYAGIIIAIFQLYLLFINVPSTDSINDLRMSMLPTPDILPLALVLLIYKKMFKININTTLSNAAFFIILISFIISFSRTLVLEFLCYLIMFSINNKFIRKNLVVYFFLLLSISLGYFVLINNTFGDQFIEKIIKTFTEVSSNNNWNELLTILSNWRGYEVYSALNQFNMSDTFTKFFGEGLGSRIYVGPYAVYVGVNDVSIPYLHNSYYTLLIKLGYIGLSYYILYLLFNFLYYLKKSYIRNEYLLVIAILAILAINSKIMQGVVIVGRDAILLTTLGFLTTNKVNPKNASLVGNKGWRIDDE